MLLDMSKWTNSHLHTHLLRTYLYMCQNMRVCNYHSMNFCIYHHMMNHNHLCMHSCNYRSISHSTDFHKSLFHKLSCKY